MNGYLDEKWISDYLVSGTHRRVLKHVTDTVRMNHQPYFNRSNIIIEYLVWASEHPYCRKSCRPIVCSLAGTYLGVCQQFCRPIL
jgi:hypothetical protein